MTTKNKTADAVANAREDHIDDKRRKALLKLGKLGVTSAGATVAVLAMTRAAAGSPI